MKIILHIGQSKTGTSSIQSFLSNNQNHLMEKGILYPSPRISGMPLRLGSHNALADALAGKSVYPHLSGRQYFEQFFSMAEECHARLMILSAEHFFGGEPRLWQAADLDTYRKLYEAKIRSLSEYLSGHEVTIVVYLRPQIDWLSSNISQVIVHGKGNGTGETFKDDRAQFESTKEALRYGWRLDLWKSIIAPEGFVVIPYVRKSLVGENSVSDFLRRAGIESDVPAGRCVNIEANKSVTREYIEVKKRLNRTQRSAADERIIVQCLVRLSRESRYGTTYRIDDGVVSDLAEYVAEDNARVSTSYLPEGQSLAACGAYAGGALEPLHPDEIDSAMEKFEREYRLFRTKALVFQVSALELLRKHARPVHVAVHQLRGARQRR